MSSKKLLLKAKTGSSCKLELDLPTYSSLKQDYKNFVIDPVNISYGKLVVLENTKFIIEYGKHYALVGKNGIGKTSLLNAISNRQLAIPEKLDIIYVRQEEPESNRTILDVLLSSDEVLYVQNKKLHELEILIHNTDVDDDILDEYNNLSQKIGSDYDKSKSRAQKILYGLGFNIDDQYKMVNIFSGGWRMRISLAKALFMTPTLLILDEPTNHLDLNANIWLMEYLKTYPKTILLVSHDKFFIDEVCSTIIHIDNKKLNYYRGNTYDQFQKQFKLEQEKIKKEWLLFEKKIISMRKSKKSPSEIDTFINNSLVIKPEKDYVVKINFLEPNIIKGSYASLENITFSYADKIIFENLNLSVNAGSRMAIVGKNGVGKSTLLKLLVGELTTNKGDVFKSSSLKIGYYNQHFEESLPFDITPVEYLMNLNTDIDITLGHKYLSLFGLEPVNHLTKINDLSGGQKARVKFASFGVMRPHLLVLDEPSNHLDIVAMDSLITALNNFKGAIILVTHNFDMITRLNCELWTVNNNKLFKYPYNYTKYIQQIYNEFNI